MKHDWRVIEKRRINHFEKSAQDKRIEAMVKKVARMTPGEVEMELDLDQLGIRAGKAVQQEPASSRSSDGSGWHGRALGREMESTGGAGATGALGQRILETKNLESGESSREQGKLFLPSKQGSGTPRSGHHHAG